MNFARIYPIQNQTQDIRYASIVAQIGIFVKTEAMKGVFLVGFDKKYIGFLDFL